MKTVIEEVTSEKIRNELPVLLSLLPAWRRTQALSFYFDRDRYLCAKSFLILQKMVMEEYAVQKIPPFSYGTNGKPYWKELPQLHFNISHCEKGIACVVGVEPVGIDIEKIFFDRELAEEVLSPLELETVLNHASPAQQFITYWTRKESFLKLMGTGLETDLKYLLSGHENNVYFETCPCPEHGYIVTTAVRKNEIGSDYC